MESVSSTSTWSFACQLRSQKKILDTQSKRRNTKAELTPLHQVHEVSEPHAETDTIDEKTDNSSTSPLRGYRLRLVLIIILLLASGILTYIASKANNNSFPFDNNFFSNISSLTFNSVNTVALLVEARRDTYVFGALLIFVISSVLSPTVYPFSFEGSIWMGFTSQLCQSIIVALMLLKDKEQASRSDSLSMA